LQIELNNVWTLIVALLTIGLGRRINARLVWLERGNIPPAVTAGLLLSLVLAGLRAQGWLDVKFSMAVRDVLLLVFFATLGFGAHLGRLASAGTAALVVCLGVVVVVVAQNLVGVAMARSFGNPVALGPFLGSIAYVGGHGTAVAWTNTPEAAGLEGAFELGIGSATLGLVLGGLVAGPVSVWLGTRDRSQARHATVFEAGTDQTVEREPAFSSDRWLPCLLWVVLCLGLGPVLQKWIGGFGLQVPTFLAVLITGVVITNVADAVKRPLDTEVTDLVGTIALRIFLAIAMLALDWVALIDHIPLLFTAAVAQVAVTVAVGVGVIYLLFGRGREGAAACGGFIGFCLGAMPVGLAVMRQLNARIGETPRALLAITLAASLFTDTANALIITAFFHWLAG